MSRLTILAVLVLGTLPPFSVWVSIAGAQEQISNLNLGMDVTGNLTQPGTTDDTRSIRAKILKSTGTADITITPATPINVAESAINKLLKDGAHIELSGAYCLFKGHLFYKWNETISPPRLDFDVYRLHKFAESKSRSTAGPITAYFLYITEAGQIVGWQRTMGPQIPEVESELMQIRVVAPSHRGSNPIPVRWTIAI